MFTHHSLPSRQRGAALFVALVFLVALTLLGLAAMGGNSLQSRMAYSVGETNLAFQGAESALATGEAWLESRVEQPAADCTAPCLASAAVWPSVAVGGIPAEVTLANLRNPAWWDTRGRKFGHAYEDGGADVLVAGQQYELAGSAVATGNVRYPRYVVEELGEDESGSAKEGGTRSFTLWYYRVTARGTGALPEPATLVQSVYSKGF